MCLRVDCHRDLNRKYGRDSDASRGSKERDSLDNMLAARMNALMQGPTPTKTPVPQAMPGGQALLLNCTAGNTCGICVA